MRTITPTLTPKHGDYKSQKEVLEAFNNDMEFIYNDVLSHWNGMTCNKTGLKENYKEQEEITKVKIRYKNNTEVFVVEL